MSAVINTAMHEQKIVFCDTFYMAKVLFDIAPESVTDASTDHLIMELSRHTFSYAVVDKDKKLMKLRFYELDANETTAMADELATIIGADAVFTNTNLKKTLLYNFPESQLVPEKHFQSDNAKALIELLHGDLNNGVVLSERIQGKDQYNVYQVPAEIHGLMERSFKNNKYWHYYSLWISASDKFPGAQLSSYLSVLFYPNRILVSAVKDQQLQLLQSYVYEAAEDAAYHLLNVCCQLDLSAETTPVLLSGMIDAASALYTEIHKYFGQASLEAFADAEGIPALGEYPSHFFSPLLKLATCVS